MFQSVESSKTGNRRVRRITVIIYTNGIGECITHGLGIHAVASTNHHRVALVTSKLLNASLLIMHLSGVTGIIERLEPEDCATRYLATIR